MPPPLCRLAVRLGRRGRGCVGRRRRGQGEQPHASAPWVRGEAGQSRTAEVVRPSGAMPSRRTVEARIRIIVFLVNSKCIHFRLLHFSIMKGADASQDVVAEVPMLQRTLRAGCMARPRSALLCLSMRRGARERHFRRRRGRFRARGEAFEEFGAGGALRGSGRANAGVLVVVVQGWLFAMRRAERRCASTGAREPAWGRRGRRGWGLVEVTCGPGGRRQRAAASGALARPAWRGEEVDGVCREAVLVRGATHLRVGFGSRGGQRSRRAAGVVWGTSTCGAGATTR